MRTKPTKYTTQFVEGFLQTVLADLYEDESMFFLAEYFSKQKISAQRYSDWRETFKKNKRIQELYKQIETVLEGRLVGQSARGKLNPTMAIFVLKNKHGYKDQSEGPQVNITFSNTIPRPKRTVINTTSDIKAIPTPGLPAGQS